MLKINTYQLGQPVKVMVVDEHSILSHRLEGIFIHIDREQNCILSGPLWVFGNNSDKGRTCVTGLCRLQISIKCRPVQASIRVEVT